MTPAGHDRSREDPVEVGRVETVDDVGQPDRPAARDAGEQVDDAERRERIAGLRDDRRRDVRVGQAGGCRSQRTQADGRDRTVGHGSVGHEAGISDWFTRDSGPKPITRSIADASLPPPTRTNLHRPDTPCSPSGVMLALAGRPPGAVPRTAAGRRRYHVSHAAPDRPAQTPPDPTTPTAEPTAPPARR